MSSKKALEIENLSIQYPLGNGTFFNATNNISFHVNKGEVVGLVGESGSGKSTVAKAVMGLVEHSAGRIKIDGELVPNKPKNNKGKVNKWLASKIQMVFQDAKSSLNPRETVYDVIVEGAKNQNLFEKNVESLKIDLLSKWLDKDGEEFKNTYFSQRVLSEKLKSEKLLKAKKEYDKKYSTIFLAYYDQKITLQGIKMRKIANIRTHKMSYLEYKKQINALLKANKITKQVALQRKEEANQKLKSDILKIKVEFEKVLPDEKNKFLELKNKFKVEEKQLNNDFALQSSNIEKEFATNKKTSSGDNKINKKAEADYEKFISKHSNAINKKAFYKKLVSSAMRSVSISDELANRYPGEFSGGQAQRIAIARSIVMNPEIIVADEPVASLDVSIQAQVINLLKELIAKKHLTILFIAHDLQVVRYISNRIIVLYKGEIVEEGPSDDVYYRPTHPYTQSLINAIPSIDDPQRIKKSKAYQPLHTENFMNLGHAKKNCYTVKGQHKIYASEQELKSWNLKLKLAK